jgi:hypothetical protein
MPSARVADVGDILTVVVCGLALALTLLQPWWGRDRVDADVVVAAIDRHRELIQPGDLVLVHPPWRDDVVELARRSLTLPPGAHISEAFTRRSTDAWPAITVVAEGVHPWPAAIEARRRASHAAIIDDGTVRFFRLPADPAATSTVGAKVGTTAGTTAGTDLIPTRVEVSDAAGARTDCPWDSRARRHVCTGLAAWMTVGADTLVVNGRNEACTWAHPISGGRVVIDFDTVDVSHGLHLQAALSDAAVDNPDGAAVNYALVVDDVPSAQPLVVHRRRGFQSMGVPPRAGTARVQLIVSTEHDGQRHTCFRLRREAP